MKQELEVVAIGENPHCILLDFCIFFLFILSFEGRFLVGCVRGLGYMVNEHDTTSTLEKRRGCVQRQ